MFIRNSGPYDINKFDSMSYAKFWVNVKGKDRVDVKDSYRKKTKNVYDNKANSLYFDESTIFKDNFCNLYINFD